MTAPISNGPTTHGYTTMRDATAPLQRHFREKVRPARQKTPIWANVSVQGELFHAFTMTQLRWANFFTHEARQRGDVETNNTTARP